MDYKQRIEKFKDILNSEEPISLPGLCSLCIQGIPDEYSLRAKAWMLMLEFLPTDRSNWQSVLEKHRKTYTSFVQELLIDPWRKLTLHEESGENSDHPLNTSDDSKWKEYFDDNQILEQIDKDIRRTLPDLSFFQGKSEINKKPSVNNVSENISVNTEDDKVEEVGQKLNYTKITSIDQSQETPVHLSTIDFSKFQEECHLVLQGRIYRLENESTSSSTTALSTPRQSMDSKRTINAEAIAGENKLGLHREAAERILFIYAKLNPGIGYVQGMNEILAPLYYVLATDPTYENYYLCECDAFFLFTQMMVQVRDLYEKTLDHDSDHGIHFLMSKFTERLKKYDYELWENLEEKQIHPTYYSFRWFTCLLSQEFPLPDVIRLWDSIIADQMKARLFGKNDDGFNGAYDFLMDFCCSILIELRESILERNFADSIKLLQAHFNVDMPKLLNLTFELQHLRKTSKNDEDMSYVRKNSYNTNALANSLKNRVLSTYNTVKANVPQSSSSYTDNNKQKEPLEEKRSFFPSFRSSLDGVSPTQGRKSGEENIRTIFAKPTAHIGENGWSNLKVKGSSIFQRFGNFVGDTMRYITEEEESSEEEDLTTSRRKIGITSKRKVSVKRNVI
ncbi:RabGAP Tbc13 [Schizosaccharomyces pombe]|uniref:TBC domain-containing protein C1952.17c n=1 Tax=Schizosaccharomyces pombe (strain 972 / ATCC 24843) TaxID=284812 RepID=YLOH_SCHPO|nr:putative GTPase-activating protein [Schizosaccharomyces pombe]Q9URY3.4 RecName: Full=TBC domain-containing protein C1952.17c [Schizosaccharomyces pombe 972h-]CAB52581.2 GTPase activating protein (predicted) [Schizosaccharomyces pombe]|eukprot:NP_594819.2 putative GTPase-activating protein [Schizosaccharomyces pombe]